MCFLAYIPPQKFCRTCQTFQSWESFNRDKRTPDGMQTCCRICMTWKQRVLYAKHQAKNVAKARQRRLTEGEKLRAQARARYAANPEHYRAAKREESVKYPEKIATRRKQQYYKHRSKRIKSKREHYQRKKHQWRDWRYNNLVVVRLIAARRRARKKQLPETFTLEERQFMLEYWQYACAICGNQEGFYWTLADDHWIPLNDPQCPGTVAENIIPLCHGDGGCNNRKNDSNPVIWLSREKTPAQAKRILQAVKRYFGIVQARREPVMAK